MCSSSTLRGISACAAHLSFIFLGCRMGLGYEWTHFLVHTRVSPVSGVAKKVRQNHMMHHCRNENYWLSFMVPDIDKLFGTCPKPVTYRPETCSHDICRTGV